MKDQVVMSPYNGQLAIAIPLYRLQHSEVLTGLGDSYSLQVSNSKPTAYAIDCDKLGIRLMDARFVEKHLKFLGEL